MMSETVTDGGPDGTGRMAGPETCLPPSLVADWLDGATAILDDQAAVVDMDPPMREWLGGSAANLDGRPFWDLLKERCPPWVHAIDSFLENPGSLRRLEMSLPGNSADPQRWFRLESARAPSAWVVRLSSVLPRGAELGETGWDARLPNESASRELFLRVLRAEAQLEKLARYWPGVIFTQRPDLTFQSVTGRIQELTGRSPAQWGERSTSLWDVVHEGDASELRRQIDLAVEGRRSSTATFRIRNLSTGRVSYILEHRQPVISGTGLLVGYEGVWLDVTRQTLAEKLLTSAAWKETLAVLTMGLAHDFSNVMAGIHSLSESFLTQLEEGHAFREGLGLIRKSSLQASQLVHRIVNLHLGKPGERSYHDLNQIVGELLELVRKVIPRRIEIATDLAPETLAVYVDAVEFRQVIINLALNAADAMPERGRILLRTWRITEKLSDIRFHGVVPRFPGACLTVEDTGCGIKASHRDLIFDPFFTTKSGGKGSGLGLYNARLFAEKHQGAVWVQSEEGRGASFTVGLPEADFSEMELPQASTPSTRRALILFGPACALFDATAETLRTEDYHVAAAHTLERVADFLAAGDYAYGAVLVLTEAGGAVLAPHVAAWRRVRPRVRIILRSIGRSTDELESDLVRLVDAVVGPESSERFLLERLKENLQG